MKVLDSAKLISFTTSRTQADSVSTQIIPMIFYKGKLAMAVWGLDSASATINLANVPSEVSQTCDRVYTILLMNRHKTAEIDCLE